MTSKWTTEHQLDFDWLYVSRVGGLHAFVHSHQSLSPCRLPARPPGRPSVCLSVCEVERGTSPEVVLSAGVRGER